jgi:hypothetical protein
VISIFYETKTPMVDMQVPVYSKFRKNKIWKKMQSPSSMRNKRFHLPSVGASFKKKECCTPILPKC